MNAIDYYEKNITYIILNNYSSYLFPCKTVFVGHLVEDEKNSDRHILKSAMFLESL